MDDQGTDDGTGLDSLERELKGMLDDADLGEAAPETAQLIGETIAGTYTILRELGEGGMGTVFVAKHERTGGEVALKLIKTSRLGNATSIKRFELEAKHTASLNHPNIVRVFDYGQDDDLFYLAMEFVPGQSVQDLLDERGALDPSLAVTITSQVLRALSAAHESEQRIIHRDIKPGNILVTDPDGEPFVKVLDFGIARAIEGPAATTQGMIGSPSTMAPEQFEGGEIGPATDLYALGCTMYGMLSGRPPFSGTISQLAMKHVNEDAAALSDERLPLPLVQWVTWLMQKDPAARPASAKEALDALLESTGATSRASGAFGRLQLPEPQTAEPAPSNSRLAIGLGAVAVVAGGLWFATRAPEPAAVAPPSDTTAIAAKTAEPELRQLPRNLPMGGIISPDGTRLLYAKAESLEIVPIQDEGGHVTTLTVPAETKVMTINWYPDGERFLATLVQADGTFALWTLSMTNEWAKLLDHAAFGVVSPDGKRLSFTRTIDQSTPMELFVSDADGRNSASIATGSWGGPGWLSDSSAVVFLAQQGKAGLQVMVANSATNRSVLSDARLFVDGMAPTLAPLPGRRLVFGLGEASQAGSPTTNLWTISLDDELNPSEPKRLTDTQGFAYAGLQTSEFGGNAVYCRATYQTDVSAVRRGEDGAWSQPQSLLGTSREERVSDIADDGRVLFTSDRTGFNQIYEQMIDGREARKLTSSKLTSSNAVFVPNSKDILYWETDESVDTLVGSTLMRLTPGAEPRRVLDEPRGGKQDRHAGMSYPTRVNIKCSPDADPACVMFERIEQDMVFFSVDLDSGSVDRLFAVPVGSELSGSANHFALRAEEPRIALSTRSAVQLFHIDGKSAGQIAYVEAIRGREHLAWSPGKDAVVSLSWTSGVVGVSELAKDGTVTAIATLGQDSAFGYTVSPDGNRLAWSQIKWECPTWEIQFPSQETQNAAPKGGAVGD